MPISDGPRAAVLALLLGGCAAGLSGTAPDRTTVTVAGRNVTVAAPPGFCVDERSTSLGPAGAFVLVSDCALLGAPATEPPVGAVMTASVSAAPLEGETPAQSLAALESFVQTAAGRAMLGRSGEGGRIRVLASQQRGDALYLYVEDRGAQPVADIEPRFWRAFLDVGGRLTALSLLAFEDAGVSPQQALDLLAGFADATTRANPPAS